MKRKTCIFKNFVMLFMAIGLFTVFIGCDDKNDEVGPLRQEVQALRADLTKEFDSKVAAKTTELQKQLDDTKAKVDQLSTKKGVTTDELNAAKQEVINATVTKVAFDDYVKSVKSKIENAATTSELNALKTDLEKVESRVSALETLVGDNKTALDNALNALDARYKTQVDALQASINANKSSLTELLNQYRAAKGNYANLNERLAEIERKMGTSVVSGILNSRLTSLVVVPDFVADGGGSLPIVKYTPIETPCGLITPVKGIQLKYQLSPSTVTAADIDVNNLRFKYNAPQVLSAKNKKDGDLMVNAKFDKIENGVLYVWATPDDLDKAYHGKVNNDNRIDQIMLQVPLTNGNSAVVSSDWVKIIYDTTARAPFLVKHEGNDPLTKSFELAKSIGDAQAQTYGSDDRIVELAWNETKDLQKVVEAVLENNAMSREMYGFDKDFTFAIAGKYFVGGNNTNQQEFLKLDGSLVSTRVYDVNDPNKVGYNKASIGREPVVAVILKRGGADCLVGYLKLKITKEKPAAPVVYNETFDAGIFTPICEADSLRVVDTKMMNERFYAKFKMSKEDFHNEFTLYNVNGGVGTISVTEDAGDKTSYNLWYKLSADELWQNAGKEITKTAEFRNNVDPNNATRTIRVKFTARVKSAETLNLERDPKGFTIDEYWYGYKNGKRVPATESAYTTIVHNVATPKSTTDKNPDNATFENNINNAFQTKGVMLDIPAGYKYSYKFDVAANQPLTAMGYEVTIDGQTLKARKNGGAYSPIATISKDSIKGDLLTYQNNKFAKELLNKAHEYVKVKLVLDVKKECGTVLRDINVSIDKLPAGSKDRFDVVFVRPIKGSAKDPRNLIDAVDLGEKGSYIDMRDLVDLIDWRARKFQDYPNYYYFYGVESILADIDNITTNLTSNGVVPSTLKLEQVDIDANNKKFGRLTYKNNGSNVQSFELYVPVTVKYKWGTITEVVTVKVNKTINGGARKRVK